MEKKEKIVDKETLKTEDTDDQTKLVNKNKEVETNCKRDLDLSDLLREKDNELIQKDIEKLTSVYLEILDMKSEHLVIKLNNKEKILWNKEYSELIELLKKILSLHKKEREKENNEFLIWEKTTEKWSDLYLKIFSEIPQLINTVKEYEQQMDKGKIELFPEVLKNALINRVSGISIILKMLSRLPDRKKKINDVFLSFPEPETLKNDMSNFIIEIRKSSYDTTKEDFCKKTDNGVNNIKEKYNNYRDTNYNAVRDQREASERVKRNTLSFLEQNFIPIIDGIDSGLENSDEMKTALAEFTEYQETIDLWFGVYSKIYEKIKDFFNKTGIKLIETEKNSQFDENFHNAICTVEIPDKNNETINSVLRNGYTIEGIIIRPVDVEVVINSEPSIKE